MPAPTTDAVRLPSELAENATGGFGYMTTIVKTGSGAEQRIMHWNEPLGSWTVNAEGDESKALLLQSFFMARRGSGRGFLFKNPIDFQVSTPTSLVQVTPTTWQLVKQYTDAGGFQQVKTIYKPAFDGIVHIWNGGTQVSTGWSVDTTSGIVTFASAPGYTPAATFDFDIPVRLREDMQTMTLQNIYWITWPAVLDELRR